MAILRRILGGRFALRFRRKQVLRELIERRGSDLVHGTTLVMATVSGVVEHLILRVLIFIFGTRFRGSLGPIWRNGLDTVRSAGYQRLCWLLLQELFLVACVICGEIVRSRLRELMKWSLGSYALRSYGHNSFHGRASFSIPPCIRKR
jgi:hypothetical protein